MSSYQLVEADNMQPDNDPSSMPLTPRVELKIGNELYMSCSDLSPVIDVHEGERVRITTRSKLVTGSQAEPPSGRVICVMEYLFEKDVCSVKITVEGTVPGDARIVFPFISASGERSRLVGDRSFSIAKKKGKLLITADRPCMPSTDPGKRVFNYVPGFEAIPVTFRAGPLFLRIAVTN
jgi:hypothetical protein